MARNKSEEVQKLKARVLFLQTRLGEMSKQATKGAQDALSMMELVEEARQEADKYREIACAGHIARPLFPWEALGGAPEPPPALPVGGFDGSLIAPDTHDE